MSHCLQLLAAFNSTVPGLAERLLVRASTPLIKDGSEAAILSNRLLYLIRQHCVREILSPARRSEVLGAIVPPTL